MRRLGALKLIMLGKDTKQVVARFEAERQALANPALTSNPAIALLLQSTRPTGRVAELTSFDKTSRVSRQGSTEWKPAEDFRECTVISSFSTATNTSQCMFTCGMAEGRRSFGTVTLSLKRQLPMANLRKILAIKSFRISHQIHKGYASIFVKPFSSRLLQIFTMFNCRFKDYDLSGERDRDTFSCDGKRPTGPRNSEAIEQDRAFTVWHSLA